MVKTILVIIFLISGTSASPVIAQSDVANDYNPRESLYQYERRKLKEKSGDYNNDFKFRDTPTPRDDRYENLFKNSKGSNLSYKQQRKPKSSEGVLNELLKTR